MNERANTNANGHTNPKPDVPGAERPEAELQAYLDGELSEDRAKLIEARIAASEIHAQKYRVLKAVKDALDAAAPAADPFDEEEAASLANTAGRPTPARSSAVVWWIGASVAAAAAILIAIVLLRREDTPDRSAEVTAKETTGPVTDENDVASLSVARETRPARMFSDTTFTLKLTPKRARLVFLPPWKKDTTPASAAAAMVKVIKGPPTDGFLPIYVRAAVRGPTGKEWKGVVAWDVANSGKLSLAGKANVVSITFRLLDILCGESGIAPYSSVNPTGNAFEDDFLWIHGGQRVLLDRPGRYTIRFAVDTLPAREEYDWPQFDRPLEATLQFDVVGHVGAWSHPTDGLRFRLASPRGAYDRGEPVPFALQIENIGSDVVRYNYMGFTQVKIPQPYHFDLELAGRTLPLREKLTIVHGAGSLFTPHHPGQIRTILLTAGHWLRDGTPLNRVEGAHDLSVRFHFEPLTWSNDRGRVWKGETTTPVLPILVR